jgi:hypothetical protein
MSTKIMDILVEESENSTIDAIDGYKLQVIKSLYNTLKYDHEIKPEDWQEDTILDIKLIVELFKIYHRRSQEILKTLKDTKLDLFEGDELSRTKVSNFIEKVKKDTKITHAKLSSTDINKLSTYF